MKLVLISTLTVSLLFGCSGRKLVRDRYPDDLHLISSVTSECADSIRDVCYEMKSAYPWRITILGVQDDERMIVRSALENAFLERDIPLIDTPACSDSLNNQVEISVLDLGIRYREIETRGITRAPWVKRDARCTVAARCIAWNGSIVFSDQISAQSLDWIPGSFSTVLNDERFPPSGRTVPNSSGILGPVAVVAAAGSLLALFFITSE